MARATQRSVESYQPPPSPKNLRINPPPPPMASDPFVSLHDELPPPHDDASGFIDLDKLREAAMAQAAAAPPPPPPFNAPASSLAYQSHTAPPVAATLPAVAPPQRSGAATGILVGSAIAAAGLIGSFFIVSRGITIRDLGIPLLSKQESMSLQAKVERARAAPAPQPVAPRILPATPTAATANGGPGATAAAPTQQAAPTAEGATPSAASPAALAAKDLGDLDSASHLDSAQQKAKARREKLRALRAKRAKSKADKSDGVADSTDETPTPNPAFLQSLQKSADPGGAPAAADPAPAAEAPPPKAAPPAPIAGPPGLAAAIQKAVVPDTPAPAPAPPPVAAAPAAAPAANLAGVPEAPSLGAVRSALAAQLGEAKSCVRDQDEPSRASLTFGSDGHVRSVSVSGPAAGTPAEACIRTALQKATVGPFSRPTFVVGLTLRP